MAPASQNQARRVISEPLPSLFHLPAPWVYTWPPSSLRYWASRRSSSWPCWKWVAWASTRRSTWGTRWAGGRPLSFPLPPAPISRLLPSLPSPPLQLTNSMMSNFLLSSITLI